MLHGRVSRLFQQMVANVRNDALIKTAPRATQHPHPHYKPKIINVSDIYDGRLVYEQSLTSFAHKLHRYVTKIDPYFTQFGSLPSLLECFAVSDCLRDINTNQCYIDFKGNPNDHMIQFWLELITTGCEKSLIATYQYLATV